MKVLFFVNPAHVQTFLMSRGQRGRGRSFAKTQYNVFWKGRKMEEKLFFLKVSDIKPYENNAKIHTQEQIDMIIKSINEFGFTNPILIDEDNNCLAGHGRLIASEQMGLKTIPCRLIRGLSKDQKRALILADNKIAEMADWDNELLNIELREIQGIDMQDFGFIDVTDIDIDDLFIEQTENTEQKRKNVKCPYCGEIFEF